RRVSGLLRRVAHLELSKPDLRELPADQAGEQQKHEHEGELGRGGTAFPPAHQIRMTRKCCALRYEGRGWSSASVSIPRSEEHTSELQSRGHLVCRLLLEKKKKGRQQIEGARRALRPHRDSC